MDSVKQKNSSVLTKMIGCISGSADSQKYRYVSKLLNDLWPSGN
jgi:hypothetical protein